MKQEVFTIEFTPLGEKEIKDMITRERTRDLFFGDDVQNLRNEDDEDVYLSDGVWMRPDGSTYDTKD